MELSLIWTSRKYSIFLAIECLLISNKVERVVEHVALSV